MIKKREFFNKATLFEKDSSDIAKQILENNFMHDPKTSTIIKKLNYGIDHFPDWVT